MFALLVLMRFAVRRSRVLTILHSATVSNVITLDTHLSFVGEWSFEQNALTSDDATFHTTSNEGDQAFFNFSGTAFRSVQSNAPNVKTLSRPDIFHSRSLHLLQVLPSLYPGFVI